MTLAQVSYAIRSPFLVTGAFGWARSRDRAFGGDPKVDVFTYDLGAEFRAPRWTAGHATTFRPFAGVGVGRRTYNYRNLDFNATHNVAAYLSAGGEFIIRRVGLRLEVRDYVGGFKPLSGEGPAETRNDVVVMAGLRVVTR